MSSFDLKLDGIWKRYRIREDMDVFASAGILKRTIQRFLPPMKEFWAVRDVSFDVKPGEVLGIIGHNGAGKSTILKMLSSIITPTRGEIVIRGRLAALIEVGSGFHPELTGRENVYLSGSLLGMSRREITKKFAEIVEFAGIRQFIDIPVKRYSSGMFVRLGFSIAAHLDPDILLLDEVLAVGDADFQEKCMGRFQELRTAGTTIVYISHDLTTVERLCDRVLLLQKGEIISEGAPNDVIAVYKQRGQFHTSTRERAVNEEGMGAVVTGIHFSDENGEATTDFRTGYPLNFRVDYEVTGPEASVSVDITVFFNTTAGGLEATLFTRTDHPRGLVLSKGKGSVEFTCEECCLAPGLYDIDVMVGDTISGSTFEWQHRCSLIHVKDGKRMAGRFHMPARTQLARQKVGAS